MFNKIIKRILKEESGKKYMSWGSETKSLKPTDKSKQKFAEVILKNRHQFIKNYNQRRREGDATFHGYPDDYNEFILNLKNGFPTYEGFGHMIQTTLNPTIPNPLLMGTDIAYLTKLMTEYILNYGEESNERVDVVDDWEMSEYIDAQFFDCSDIFFEKVWDDLLSGKSNYWNEDLKDNMWSDIESEVVEKMQDVEWQEENGMEFDDVENLETERDYFMSYWYYPIHSLGWDKITLCEWYKEFINPSDIKDFFFNDKDKDSPSNNIWIKLPIGLGGSHYIINRNKIF
jgi:hypothetical protein